MTSPDTVAGKRLRILYLTQWFEPEPAFKGARFARALQEAGHDVQVVTGFPNYPGGKIYPGYRVRMIQRETIEGVPVDRLPLWPSHDQSSLGRMANYLSFFVSALFYCLRSLGRFDVVYVYHPPMTAGLAAALAGILRRTPFILDVQDLWPDSVAVSGMANSAIVKPLGAMCRFVYRRAKFIICQSDGMLELLVDRGVPRNKLARIYNWSNYSSRAANSGLGDVSDIPNKVAEAFEGAFNVVYGGNIGQAQALEYLVEAAIEAHQTVPRIRFHIFGNGIENDKITGLAQQSNGAVIVHGPMPRETVDRIFERADALALHLRDEPLFRHTIPSKLQHYISVGKPILAGIAGEGARLLEQSGAALVVAPADKPGLAKALIDVASQSDDTNMAMARCARAFYSQHLSFDRALSDTIAIIERVAKSIDAVRIASEPNEQ